MSGGALKLGWVPALAAMIAGLPCCGSDTDGDSQSVSGRGGTTAAGAGGSAGQGGAPPASCEPETVGNWALGDNLFMTVEQGCFVSNFCSIEEGIHTQGALDDGMLHLQSVGGMPLSFAYTLSDDIFTMIDGYGDVDLPLFRRDAPLPEACPPPL